MLINKLFDATVDFTAGDAKRYRISPYIVNSKYLQEHLEILREPSSGLIDYSPDNMNELAALEAWVQAANENSNEYLLGVYEESNNSLIGTSKVSTCSNRETFSAGIMVGRKYVGKASLGKYVKGYILNKCFLEAGMIECVGGCLQENLGSISIYRYFHFEAKADGKSKISFSLGNAAHKQRVVDKLKVHMLKAGFDVANANNHELLEHDISMIRGYSSLTFMNLLSLLMEKNVGLDIISLFECKSMQDIVLAMGPEFFSLVDS